MPMGSVQFVPGVNTQKTLSDNQAGVSQSQLVRYKTGMIQTYGGWEEYVSFAIGSTVRDLHAWQDNAGNQHLGVGATSNLVVITSGSAQDITPQTNTTNPTPNFSITNGSSLVTVVDGGSSASIFNAVYFNTPVSIGPYLLNGAYEIATVTASSVYTIPLGQVSTATVASSGKLPIFSTSSGSATVTVTLSNNGFTATAGLFRQFIATTTVGGLTIQGPYQIATVIDSTNFTINANSQATTTATATMNSSLAQLVYYITLGPQQPGGGFGGGGFGSGGFGVGTTTTGSSGTPITATDWTQDNWGEALLACPEDGPLYVWSPDSGYINTQVVTTAPFFNGGIFVSMPQQILVLWRSCQSTGVQDPLLVRWSNATDYTNYTVSNQTVAGSFHIPTGSLIVGGLQGPSQGMIWTDVDLYVMQYIGGTLTFNFTKIGTGCGLIGSHAAGVIAGFVFWCSYNNFYVLGANGVQVLPCTVWDFIFQNMNRTYAWKIRCATNAAFNEVMWFFPSADSTGENDSYVKYNIIEQEWDYGSLPRTAWVDVSVLGNPIGSDTGGFLYQHETGTTLAGVSQPLFQSGYWTIADGNDLAFVDFIIPDMKWGLYSGAEDAQVLITIFAVDYPGDTPRSYGPYTVTQQTEYIPTRVRGRLMSIKLQSQNSEFWRLGRIRYRYQPSGRR